MSDCERLREALRLVRRDLEVAINEIDRELSYRASEETSCSQREATAFVTGGYRPQVNAAEEQRDTMGVTAGETAPLTTALEAEKP